MMGCIADDLSTRGALVPVLSTSQMVVLSTSQTVTIAVGTVRYEATKSLSKRVPPICTADLHMAADYHRHRQHLHQQPSPDHHSDLSITYRSRPSPPIRFHMYRELIAKVEKLTSSRASRFACSLIMHHTPGLSATQGHATRGARGNSDITSLFFVISGPQGTRELAELAGMDAFYTIFL
jgi:hypothetical protein